MDLCGEISGKIFARVKMAYEDDFHCHCVLCIIWVVFNLKSKVIKIPDACWEKEGEWKEKDCVCLEREGGGGVGYGWLCGFDTGGVVPGGDAYSFLMVTASLGSPVAPVSFLTLVQQHIDRSASLPPSSPCACPGECL